ncbi:hypothetical protein E2C01_037091 [Portunus trituberculatus]|uniref:Uncharacterized protein n=1 Tax=Portunus trituberculatus TaxID=210409 RepID=A0A5B7FED7_PORTR|nr:hypothetical protein [Portunus trituberculatus]
MCPHPIDGDRDEIRETEAWQLVVKAASTVETEGLEGDWRGGRQRGRSLGPQVRALLMSKYRPVNIHGINACIQKHLPLSLQQTSKATETTRPDYQTLINGPVTEHMKKTLHSTT